MLFTLFVTLLIAAIGFFLVKQKLFPKKKKIAKTKLDAIVISGPSGVGKGTLIQKLLKEYPDNFGFSVSHTTRAPRAGEEDGAHYHFTTREVMQKQIDNGEFLEVCDVHGNMYGTSKSSLESVRSSGKVGIIEMDVQGAQKLKKQQGSLSFYYIFVTAPSMEELEKRIVGRGSDTPEKVKIRLETALKELEFVEANDSFFDKVLKNDDFDGTYSKFVKLLKLYGAF